MPKTKEERKALLKRSLRKLFKVKRNLKKGTFVKNRKRIAKKKSKSTKT